MLRGFHQPGLLYLQLFLHHGELQARRGEKGLQGGEPPPWVSPGGTSAR